MIMITIMIRRRRRIQRCPRGGRGRAPFGDLEVRSEGGMIRLETLIELKFPNSSLFELILLLKLDKQFPVEQFEAAVSQSTAPSPPLIRGSQACASAPSVVGPRPSVGPSFGPPVCAAPPLATANLRTRILDFQRVRLKQNLKFKGWNSQVHREFPGNLESRNLSRDNLT